MRKSKDELSPLDSWICFGPGEGVTLNNRIQAMWIQKARDLRKMRGDMLAASFDVENVLDEIICEVFFPGLNKAPGDGPQPANLEAYANSAVLKNVFGRVFLRTPSNTFGRKVELFLKVSKEIRELRNLVPDQLKGDLKMVLTIRNAFAHSPVSFDIKADPSNPQLAALIVVAGKITELTPPICAQYRDLVSSTAGQLRGLLGKVQANPTRTGDSPLSRDGVIWVGHSALWDDARQVTDPGRPLSTKDLWLRASRPNLKVNVSASGGEQNGNSKGSE